MTTKSKILLAVSLAAFAGSLTGVLWGALLPVGAIVFGQFMIFTVLGKETELFDEEQCLRISLASPEAGNSRGSLQTPRATSLRSVSAH